MFGENYPYAATTRPDPANERGAWRVEVCPSKAAARDNFLNVIQVADNDCRDFGKVTAVESDTVAGAVVADRVVTFSADSRPLSACSFRFKSSLPELKILVTDLQPGMWTVTCNGKVICTGEVRQDEGLLYFSGSAGSYELKRK